MSQSFVSNHYLLLRKNVWLALVETGSNLMEKLYLRVPSMCVELYLYPPVSQTSRLAYDSASSCQSSPSGCVLRDLAKLIPASVL